MECDRMKQAKTLQRRPLSPPMIQYPRHLQTYGTIFPINNPIKKILIFDQI